jgi:glycosyltransferase involved in cell wall biosynthesis
MIIKYCHDLAFPEGIVTCPGLQSGEDLVSMIRTADFLVLTSHYETFGSVIIEALACGTPVLSTDVGIAGQVINDTNGLIVVPSDNEALEVAVVKMFEDCRTKYDRKKVRESIGSAFSNKTIGEQLTGLYENVLHHL